MKKSLAIKLQRSEKSLSKKKLTTRFNEGNALKNAKTSLRVQASPHHKLPTESAKSSSKLPSFRNKNITSLPASLLNSLSQLRVLDISHNKLSDLQIELLMNSCLKLETLSIQGNLTSVIPSAIWKVKHLEKFRHDWVKLTPSAMYESEANLKNIKILVRKPNTITKVNNVIGMSFKIYCQEILRVQMNSNLQQRVKNSQCSHFAQNQMMEAIRYTMTGQDNPIEETIEILEDKKSGSPLVAGCFTLCGFAENEVRPKEQKWKEIPMKKQFMKTSKTNEDYREESQTKIKIEKIREISETQAGTDFSSAMDGPEIVYQHQDMPFHLIMSKYDSLSHGAVDIDRILLKGYNPNTYDCNGLSAYHIAVIFKQDKGLQRLIEISFKNPGFFDLEMPSLKEGRSILHFSVFLKDYDFTKQLINFGIPFDKRDFTGARLIHLVDQNYEFLLLLRKILKRKLSENKTASFTSYPQQMAKRYTRHGPRMTQEANYKTFQNKNLNLLQMYEAAVGVRAC